MTANDRKTTPSAHRQGGESGFAIATTLLVMVAVTVVVVGLFAVARLDVATSSSFSNAYRAELAAETALEVAVHRVRDAMMNPAASGAAYTTWAYYPHDNTNTYYSALTVGRPAETHPATPWLNESNTVWLFSGGSSVADPDSIHPSNKSAGTNVNRNARFVPDGRPLYVPWETYSASTSNGNVTSFRFAYWVEDESSRVELNTAGFASRELGMSEREMLLPPPLATDSGMARLREAQKQGSRKEELFFTPQTVAQVLNDPNAASALGFLTTTFSTGQDVIQYAPEFTTAGDPGKAYRGTMKMNLNYAELIGTAPANKRVKMLVDWILDGAPEYVEWGAKNYKGTDKADAALRQEMLATIAAGIIDYRDEDRVPTQPPGLPDPRNLTDPPAPVRMLRDVNRPEFFGVEAAPVINEVQLVWNRDSGDYKAATSVTRTQNGGIFTYTIPVTWRFELWNMGDEALPARNYSVRCYWNQIIEASAFGFGGEPIPNETELVLDLGSLSFRPGEIQVIDVAKTYSSSGPNDRGTTWSAFRKGGPGTSDDQPEGHHRGAYVLFETGKKEWLHATGYTQMGQAPSDGHIATGPGNKGSSQGNGLNDPRMQPLRMYHELRPDIYQGPRDWASIGDGNAGAINNVPKRFNYQNLNFWMDRPQFDDALPETLPEAVTTVANRRFASAGELGNIFDPGWISPRGSGPPASYPYRDKLPTYYRGGATLRIGQPDSQVRYGANSWTLLDLFAVTDNPAADASRFVDPRWRGRMNINYPKETTTPSGKTSNLELAFELPQPLHANSPGGRGTSLNTRIIFDAMKDRLTRGGPAGIGGEVTDWKHAKPFYSLGEISELEAWRNPELFEPVEKLVPESKGTPSLMLDRSDRGREEAFRRASQLLTTRGEVFRVYAVGEYVRHPVGAPSEITVLGKHHLEASFEVSPEFDQNTGKPLNFQTRVRYRAAR